MNILPHNPSLSAIKFCLMVLLLTFATPPAKAQTAGEIHIGGKVYGGGKNGAINSGNTAATSDTKAEEVALTKTAFDNTADEDYAASQASQVTINSGNIKTVFGGGEQGRSYGKTSVTVNGGTVGVDGDADSANGNVFGAGDGSAAHVYGGSALLVTGGTIKGSVYGGGNEADLVGSTALTLQGGTYVGAVFGGAKMADIHGRTYVNIDGAHARNDLHIIDVYGGNDIAGKIQPSTNANWEWTHQANLGLPFTLASTPNLSVKPTDEVDGITRVNSTWNAFILATKGTTYKTAIDNLYGGGNGDYGAADASGVYVAGSYKGKEKPVIDRTYMQLQAGMYGSVYGGGNAATVAKSTDICLINDTDTKLLTADEINRIKSLLGESSKSYAFNKEKTAIEYAFNRVFGGNNKEPMAIRPNWYLEKATVNNLYSGGNAGAMTYFQPAATDKDNSYGGILLAVESKDMTVNNVYGGCRMADVDPDGVKGNTENNHAIGAEEIAGVTFQKGYAARVLIKGGNINNVYGGNDVSGNVYYGSQVEILSSINGDVYGAGNGSYAYTDNASLKGDKEWGDFYYDPSAFSVSVDEPLRSVTALSNHRPNAEKSYVHVAGYAPDPESGEDARYTFIGGGLYCGGNSATLRTTSGSLTDAKAELHIGSNVIVDKVFLGSNGENMVAQDMLKIYANQGTDYPAAYSSLDLTQSAQFEEYMRGVEVAIIPSVSFDAGYVPQSAKFGSLYCGGNVGSMSAPGLFTINFLNSLLIYDKLVGGSNNANVAKTGYNAFHMGGIIGAPASDGTKIRLNISGMKLEPHVLNGSVQNGFNLQEFNIVNGMLQHGNIYGGCYASGYINGGVEINVTENAISDGVADAHVTYNAIRDDVLASTLSVYGGGYGEETEIWGDTHVNITGNGQIMKAYGGGEMGVVGKLKRNTDGSIVKNTTFTYYTKDDKKAGDVDKQRTVASFDKTCSTTVSLNANLLDGGLLNAAKVYGGGFQGLVSGNTTVNLDQGRVYDAFGGASNADILGVAEIYVGKNSRPYVLNCVYGGNDFGGQIANTKLHEVVNDPVEMQKIVSQTYVEYHTGNIAGSLFGGPCGAYDYEKDTHYASAIAATDFIKPHMLHELLTPEKLQQHSNAGYAANSFVNIVATSADERDVITKDIFGAGQGMPGKQGAADERGSYVRLYAATTNQRSKVLSPNVYGAGDCSNTRSSLVDAFQGNFGTLFGGSHGITYQDLIDLDTNKPGWRDDVNYMGFTSAVRLYRMSNRNMDIYGGGANAGANECGVQLLGGEARNVYGASLNQGVTYAATVRVPENSTARVNAIFGGAKGGSDVFPCDVYNSFITWSSDDARVNDAIYGGNNDYRMMRNTYVGINAPVYNFEGKLTNVFGGGLGPKTVTLYTEVGLHNGAQVANVYGGGKDGQVLDTPSFRYYLDDGDKAIEGHTKTEDLKTYPSGLTNMYGYQKYLEDAEVIGFHDWIRDYHWDGTSKDYRGQPIGSYTSNGHGHAHDLYFLSTQMADMKNTNVFIERGAMVTENAYGGGLGELAQVSGETFVMLRGGTVKGNIYGGGNAGPVKEYDHLIFPEDNEGHFLKELVMSATNVDLGGGIARNVYGGGLGTTAEVIGSTNVTLGTKDQGMNNYYGSTDSNGNYLYGDPVVERSLYGGGQQGAVKGGTFLTINQGHIGYKYDSSNEADGQSNANCYVENLDLNPGDGFLVQNGNVFGGGYGEGATVDLTHVNMYGGTIRNSLYGGGEIAAVGRGVMDTENGVDRKLDHIDVAGRTYIYMYNGLVQGDVFGGGRGYSYSEQGNMVLGELLYTNGYVFGTTDVNIRGGIVGTPETLADGHGNVFGGGNIGYVYSDAEKKGKKGGATDNDKKYQGRYYTNTWKCGYCYEHDGVETIEHSLNSPHTCPVCHHSTEATDNDFKTTWTQTNKENDVVTPILSEDTRVVIEPYAQVKTAGSVAGRNYKVGDYVPTDTLNLLRNKNTDANTWALLDVQDRGVLVRNAVFAGGNVSSGSDQMYANATTVFGNSTATINDVFFRDLITVGTEHTGGLYGDGNLTFVDGYRELNISNYGTDYYGMSESITIDDYNNMTDRERAYFELKYKCTTAYTDTNGKAHQLNETISEDDYDKLTGGDRSNWTQAGFCSIYAGRLLNTIQRADFCGIFGSRLVLQGAQDRVPDVVDYTQYTINRVGEVSLNKAEFKGNSDGLSNEDKNHGNYFGIYNIVNYLGALTSDVEFSSPRTYDASNGSSYAPTGEDDKSYYGWKTKHAADRLRNNGTCHNRVALASGVYLEIVQELGSTKEEKNWGYITGVVELDLINVMPGLGGGYVYAKNVHGAPSLADAATGKHENLSIYNKDAVNNSKYLYDGADTYIETSGNFIHSLKQIVDDCYPLGGDHSQKAHYWFIKGQFYVYDQYISAYTGSSTAYIEDINLPLNVTAGAHGTLNLLNIQPNYYAYYYDTNITESDRHKLGTTGYESVLVNNVTYALNDVITYWDYMQLSDNDKRRFVRDTYVTVCDWQEYDSEGKCGTGDVHKAGEVALTNPYASSATTELVWDATNNVAIERSMLYRSSNAISHEKGYVLTVDMDNPIVWDAYHSNDDGKITTYAYKQLHDNSGYKDAPTYTPKADKSGVYGQRDYEVADIITSAIHDKYEALDSHKPTGSDQAIVVPAYVATEEASYTLTINGTQTPFVTYPGVAIPETDYNQIGAVQTKFEEAYVCTNTLELSAKDFVFYGDLIPESRLDEIITSLADADTNHDEAYYRTLLMKENFSKAYYCTTAGKYGGDYYEAGKKYTALESWSSLSTADRQNFDFTFDALDALYDSSYPGNGEIGNMWRYDGLTSAPANYEGQLYSKPTAIDYVASWVGYTDGNTSVTEFHYGGYNKTVEVPGDPLSREQYEALPNEQYHFSRLDIKAQDVDGNSIPNYYVVKNPFIRGEIPYVVGQTISKDVYESLSSDQKNNIQVYQTTNPSGADYLAEGTYYFCRDSYQVETVDTYNGFTSIGNVPYNSNSGQVPIGTLISVDTYKTLPNYQRGFAVSGISPTERSTFYVSRESDINELSKEKVITVIYQYEYEESDASMTNIEKIMERHIINIHIEFKSGVPTIPAIQAPKIVLPGTTVGLQTPVPTPGAYEILGGGWEMYTSETDAKRHQNGTPYENYITPMYWYQDGYYVAYYAKTYLGKTYSNAVQFKVANYHDIADVMADKNHYMYIDHADVHRNSKIYIGEDIHNVEITPADGQTPAVTADKSELDMLYDLYEETLKTKEVDVMVQKTDGSGKKLYYHIEGNTKTEVNEDQATDDDKKNPVYTTKKETVYRLDEHVQGGKNLEFYLKNDVSPLYYTTTGGGGAWSPIGTGTYTTKEGVTGTPKPCFGGNLHGNGHTISGMENSLFAKLCGNVYNLGVTGSFTGSGIADNAEGGFANNCWIYTSVTPREGALPVVGTINDINAGAAGIHALNCYYPRECGYNYGWTEETKNLYATPMYLKSFNNGEVAYDLNGFYLIKRYYDKTATEGTEYTYLTQNADGSLKTESSTGKYPQGAIYNNNTLGYVENFFYDGDFVYAEGVIPTEDNERLHGAHHYPIWPDDYLFFGQMLTYGYIADRPYQEFPSVINRTPASRLYTTNMSNQVMRAPAYYRSAEMNEAHFNPHAVFADHVEGHEDQKIHTGLTAIDLTGYNDVYDTDGNVLTSHYQLNRQVNYPSSTANAGTRQDGYNFTPILDFTTFVDDGFETHGITQNLLAYTPAPGTAAEIEAGKKQAETQTNKVLTRYFNEPEYTEDDPSIYTDGKEYRRVAVNNNTSAIHGHVVQKNGAYVAYTDHFLVDRQDFNAPIAYKFDSDHRMWYQRKPDNYADMNKGWEGVSLPFAAELVSTQDKGEITHFYKSASGDYVAGYSSGHEYWLREFTGIVNTTNDQVDPAVTTTTAAMNYPEALAGSAAKTVTNTFLWDYFYNADGVDANGDLYKKQNDAGTIVQDDGRRYYEAGRTYENYPLSVPGKPYIAGFPGARYYEFDLSGTFVPENSGTVTPAKLPAQTISFVSNTGIRVAVSDAELEGQCDACTHDGYMFNPNYLNVQAPASGVITSVDAYNAFYDTQLAAAEFDALSEAQKTHVHYLLNADGSAYVQNTEAQTVGAFRPFFATKTSPKLKAPATRSIVFGMGDKTQFEPDEQTLVNADGGLNIYAKKGKIIVESQLDYDRPVRIVTLGGIVISSYTICPGEKVETAVDNTGIYIVNRKKLAVK